MKLGYSILFGEIVKASEIQYKDCERFQIVCPECREPIFKVCRSSEGKEDIHYLSHYKADNTLYEECELRVLSYSVKDYEHNNHISREQRLKYFLSVLKRTISLDPLYKNTPEKSHWQLEKSPVYIFFRDTAWQAVTKQDGMEMFSECADDYLWRLDDSGWELVTTFSHDKQKQISRDMWATLITSAGHSNFNFLFNHAWLKELSGIISRMDELSGIEKTVQYTRVAYMERVTKAKKSDFNILIEEMMRTQLPEGFNKIKGKEDDQVSSYFTRQMGNTMIEMVGSLLEFPYFELLKQQFGDPGKIYPYQPGVVPVDQAEIKKLEEFRKKYHNTNEMH